MSNTSEAKITAASVLAFTIPTDQPESDGTAKWNATTIVIVEISAGGHMALGTHTQISPGLRLLKN